MLINSHASSLNSDQHNRIQLLREYVASCRHESAELMVSILAQSRLPESVAIEVARLARQAGYPQGGAEVLLKSLGKGSPRSASAALQFEFAVQLSMLGDWKTAAWYFSEAAAKDPTLSVESSAEYAISKIHAWDFSAAVKVLADREFSCEQSEKSENSHSLLKLSCWIGVGGKQGAEESLRLMKDLDLAQASFSRPQLAEFWLLKAEWQLFHARDPRGALHWIERLKAEFPEFRRLTVKSWWVVLKLRLEGFKPSFVMELESHANQLSQSRNSELLRKLDILRAVVLSDENALQRVWFGSPFVGVRQFLQFLLGAAKVPSQPSYWISPKVHAASSVSINAESLQTFDLVRGTFKSDYQEVPVLKAGQTADLVLRCLASDLYRTIPLEEIFAALYPNEVYLPMKSDMRVHAQVSRSRRLLKKAGVPIDLVQDQTDRGYRLQFQSEQIQLRLPNPARTLGEARGSRTTARVEYEILQLKSVIARADSGFSATDAAQVWNVSPRTANSRIHEALQSRLLEKFGNGPRTRYRLAAA